MRLGMLGGLSRGFCPARLGVLEECAFRSMCRAVLAVVVHLIRPILKRLQTAASFHQSCHLFVRYRPPGARETRFCMQFLGPERLGYSPGGPHAEGICEGLLPRWSLLEID